MYELIRTSPGNRGCRMAHHDGVLEIMSPEFRHAPGARRLGYLIAAYAEAFGIDFEPAGATTFRKGVPHQRKGLGKEPDESFYLGAAAALVRDRDTLDLSVDPPPSLWIEVDNRAGSRAKLPLYAKLGVPEVWRYRPRTRRLWFGRPAGSEYESIPASVALPGLIPELVLGLHDEARTLGMPAWNRWLREERFTELRRELRERGEGG